MLTVVTKNAFVRNGRGHWGWVYAKKGAVARKSWATTELRAYVAFPVLVKASSTFYGRQMNPAHTFHRIHFLPISMLPYHLSLYFPNGLFPFRFQTEIMYASAISPTLTYMPLQSHSYSICWNKSIRYLVCMHFPNPAITSSFLTRNISPDNINLFISEWEKCFQTQNNNNYTRSCTSIGFLYACLRTLRITAFIDFCLSSGLLHN